MRATEDFTATLAERYRIDGARDRGCRARRERCVIAHLDEGIRRHDPQVPLFARAWEFVDYLRRVPGFHVRIATIGLPPLHDASVDKTVAGAR